MPNLGSLPVYQLNQYLSFLLRCFNTFNIYRVYTPDCQLGGLSSALNLDDFSERFSNWKPLNDDVVPSKNTFQNTSSSK